MMCMDEGAGNVYLVIFKVSTNSFLPNYSFTVWVVNSSLQESASYLSISFATGFASAPFCPVCILTQVSVCMSLTFWFETIYYSCFECFAFGTMMLLCQAETVKNLNFIVFPDSFQKTLTELLPLSTGHRARGIVRPVAVMTLIGIVFILAVWWAILLDPSKRYI